MEIRFHMYGTRHAEFYLRGVGRRGLDPRHALEVVGLRMLRLEKELFRTSGASGGQPWAPLSQATIKRKRSRGGRVRANASRVLIRTGTMQKALTDRSSRYNNFRVSRSHVSIGSHLDYVELHAEGTRHMPSRPPIMFTHQQEREMIDIIENFIFHGRLSRPDA